MFSISINYIDIYKQLVANPQQPTNCHACLQCYARTFYHVTLTNFQKPLKTNRVQHKIVNNHHFV